MHLTMLLDMAAEGFGDRQVVGSTAAGMTAHELRGRALAGARLLERGGADALVYVATNGPAYPVAMFAAAYAGLPLVPLNYRLGEAQLGHLLTRHPRALVIAEQRVRPIVERAGLDQLSTTDWIGLTASGAERAAEPAPADPRVRARLASAGRVIPAVELRILDSGGNQVPPGTFGRICVRGDQVSAEYDGTGVAVDSRGFFDTRDEGYLDEDGFLFIGGRADDTIIRGGENIAPAEIESVISEDPAVLDVAVVGVPDDEWGQRIEAVVVPAPGRTVDTGALRELVRGRLRGSKTPDRVHVVPELPRTETGKLIRRQVSAMIA